MHFVARVLPNLHGDVPLSEKYVDDNLFFSEFEYQTNSVCLWKNKDLF